MKPIRITWCLAAAALVLGCEQTTEPVTTTQSVDLPTFTAERTDEIREFIWDWEDFIPCANDDEGEWVLWDGILRWNQIRRDNPAGVEHRDNKDVEFVGYSYDDFMAFGQTTGDVWIVDKDNSQWNARRNNKGDFQNWHQNYKFVLVNVADGSVLNVQGVRNSIIDKDGNLVWQEDFNGSCPQTW